MSVETLAEAHAAGWRIIKRGVRVLTAAGDDLTDTSDPSQVMMRQIAGAFADYEKTRLVSKLKAARERKRKAAGKCEGRKSILPVRAAATAASIASQGTS